MWDLVDRQDSTTVTIIIYKVVLIYRIKSALSHYNSFVYFFNVVNYKITRLTLLLDVANTNDIDNIDDHNKGYKDDYPDLDNCHPHDNDKNDGDVASEEASGGQWCNVEGDAAYFRELA